MTKLRRNAVRAALVAAPVLFALIATAPCTAPSYFVLKNSAGRGARFP